MKSETVVSFVANQSCQNREYIVVKLFRRLSFFDNKFVFDYSQIKCNGSNFIEN